MSKYRDQIRAEQREHDDYPRPQTDEELAWDYGLDLQDVRADAEFVKDPFVPPYLRSHALFPWLNDDQARCSLTERDWNPDTAS